MLLPYCLTSNSRTQLTPGYSTMKGELVRMILYPKPIKFSFYTDALMFVFFLALLATVGFIFTFTFLSINKVIYLEIGSMQVVN